MNVDADRRDLAQTVAPLTSPPTTRVVYGAIMAVGLVGVGLFSAIMAQARVPVGYLTRDPSATAEEGWYLGLASSLGVIGWTVAATIFGVCAWLARAQKLPRSTTTGLLGASAMTAVLLLDDLFLIHDDILLRALGSEKPVLAAYALMFATWLVVSRSRISQLALAPLTAAGIGFTTSVIIDRIWESDQDLRLLIEDGTKFFGIWSWVVFAAVYSLDQLVGTKPALQGGH